MSSPSIETPAVFSESLSQSHSKEKTPEVVIRPISGWAGVNLRQLWLYRELCWTFAIRDVKLRYRQTMLGVIWVLAQPLIAAFLFSFIFNKVAKLPTDGVPAFLFAFVGLMGWNVFSTTLSKASTSVVSQAGLVSKVFFPRLLLPFSASLSALVDLCVSLVALLVLLVLHGIVPSPAILLLPVWIGLLLLLALGVGIIASALAVHYRDVMYILPVMTSFLLYASPTSYSVSGVIEKIDPKLQFIFFLNPLVGLIEAVRWSVFNTSVHWNLVLYSVAVTICLFVIAVFFFQRLERRFADVI